MPHAKVPRRKGSIHRAFASLREALNVQGKLLGECRGGGGRFEVLVDRDSESADVVGRAAAAGAEDICAGFEQRYDALDHVFGGFVVDDFHLNELWPPDAPVVGAP